MRAGTALLDEGRFIFFFLQKRNDSYKLNEL